MQSPIRAATAHRCVSARVRLLLLRTLLLAAAASGGGPTPSTHAVCAWGTCRPLPPLPLRRHTTWDPHSACCCATTGGRRCSGKTTPPHLMTLARMTCPGAISFMDCLVAARSLMPYPRIRNVLVRRSSLPLNHLALPFCCGTVVHLIAVGPSCTSLLWDRRAPIAVGPSRSHFAVGPSCTSCFCLQSTSLDAAYALPCMQRIHCPGSRRMRSPGSQHMHCPGSQRMRSPGLQHMHCLGSQRMHCPGS